MKNYEEAKPLIKKIQDLDELIDMLKECNEEPGYRLGLAQISLRRISVHGHPTIPVPVNDNIEAILIKHYQGKRDKLVKELES